MQVNTELSVELICAIGNKLNDLIRSTGELQINNKVIWNQMLHKMDNSIWRGILTTLQELSSQQPQLFEWYHLTAVSDGLAVLDRYDAYYDRVLDMKNRKLDTKKTAWRCLMTLREVYCAAIELDLPNANSSRVTSTYGNLFNAD